MRYDPKLWAQAKATQPPLSCIQLTAEKLKRRRRALADGFSLHADLAVEANARNKP